MLEQRIRTFEWTLPKSFTDDPGWRPVGAPAGWYPGSGFLSAHDTLEHLSDKADWAHELRATGVAIFDVKGVPHRSIDSISSDILAFAARDHEMTAPPAPPVAHRPLAPEHEQRVQEFARHLRERIAHGLARSEASGEKMPTAVRQNAETFVDKATPWIRLGYRVALRVYGRDGSETGLLMDHLRDAINDDHNSNPPLAGDRLTIKVDTKRRTFAIARSGNESLSRGERLSRLRKGPRGIDDILRALGGLSIREA